MQKENRSHHQILWQQYEERIQSLSQESKESKFCMEAGFVHVVGLGQYFMTKDTGDFRQFRAVACREYSLLRDDESSQPRPVTCTVNMELKSESGLFVKTILSLGSEYLMEQINMWSMQKNNNKEVPADLPEEQASQSSVKVIAARSKTKARPQ